MSWSLSHTVDAYAYADARLRELPRRALQDAAMAWKSELREAGELRGRGFNVRRVPIDILADFVSENALSERGRCSNGGRALYVDPEGWVTVPFGPDADES
jgi:hypothetical protein